MSQRRTHAPAGRQAGGKTDAAVQVRMTFNLDSNVAEWLPQCIGLARRYKKPITAKVELEIRGDGSLWLVDRPRHKPVWLEVAELVDE